MAYYVIEYAGSADEEIPGEVVTDQQLASGAASAVFNARTRIVEVCSDGPGFVRFSQGTGTPAAPEAGNGRQPLPGNRASRYQSLYAEDRAGARLYDRLAVVDA
jgi:hypothetical protein